MAGRDAGMLGNVMPIVVTIPVTHENMVKSPHIAFHEKRGIQTFPPKLAYCWKYCWKYCRTWDTEILLNNQWERMGLGYC